jgi:hypothetical protein
MELSTGREHFSLQTAKYSKENGKTVKNTVKEN